MRAIAKFAAAAALTFSAVGFAASADAMQLVQVGTSGLAGPDQISWDGTTPGQGSLSISNLTTVLNFNDLIYNDGILGQVATLNLTANSTPGSVLDTTNNPIFQETGLNGSFTFTNASNVVLLRGVFTGMWLTGRLGDTTGTAMTVLNGGTLDLSSDVVDLGWVHYDNASFSFTNVHPGYDLTGGVLQDFAADSVTGTFGGAIPEPGTWALMIVGFGGAGMMIRSRRRSLSVAA